MSNMSCEECEEALAELCCADCEQDLCKSCSFKIHRKGSRSNHCLVDINQSPANKYPVNEEQEEETDAHPEEVSLALCFNMPTSRSLQFAESTHVGTATHRRCALTLPNDPRSSGGSGV